MRHALLAFLMLAATPAYAAALDGVWFLTASACSKPAGERDAELEISGREWNYLARACELSKSGRQFVCSSDDEYVEPWKEKASYTLSGDTLTVTEDGITTTYTRCPAQ